MGAALPAPKRVRGTLVCRRLGVFEQKLRPHPSDAVVVAANVLHVRLQGRPRPLFPSTKELLKAFHGIEGINYISIITYHTSCFILLFLYFNDDGDADARKVGESGRTTAKPGGRESVPLFEKFLNGPSRAG